MLMQYQAAVDLIAWALMQNRRIEGRWVERLIEYSR
jgi:hypothetical protein